MAGFQVSGSTQERNKNRDGVRWITNPL